MIKTMFRPFFKRFFGLFCSMVFVSVLAVGLLCCFGSCLIDVKNDYIEFVNNCQNMDVQVNTQITSRDNLLNSLNNIEEIDKVDARLTIDCYLYKEEQERTIVARVFSYNEETNKIFKRITVDSVTPSETTTNICVLEKFAKNNNFKCGDTIKLGFFGMYEDFFVSEIVSTPEGIYPRANNYIWSDNYDFGYLYVSEQELSKGINTLAHKILEKVGEDPEFAEYYNRVKEDTGITIPDLDIVNDSFASIFANQLLIKNKEGMDNDAVLAKVQKAIEDNGMNVTSGLTKPYMPHIAYMDHALEQVQVASIFLPVFFYTVTMIVVGLFINQIIKTMTPQIGVFMSIGIDNNEIVRLFVLYTLIMGVTAGLLGAPVGYLLSILMSGIMKKTYSIPTITPGINPFVTIGAVLGLLIFIIVTTFIATRAIFRITPKDAVISNEAKRKSLPKPVQKLIDKAPMNIKLGVNSVAQNPRRFFVSAFSIFASLILILLSTLFFVSKTEMVDQSVNRRLNYDCQVYLAEKAEPEFINELENQPFVEENGFLDCYYTYLKVDLEEGNDVYLECLAIDETESTQTLSLINIPNDQGHGNLKVQHEGLILPKASADKLNKKKGDMIKINGHDIVISDISYQYFHPITYLSQYQMDQLGVDPAPVSSFILNIKEGQTNDFLNYMSSHRNQCLTVFTESLSKDLHGIFDALNVMIYIMVAFSLGMAFIILSIMSQNALMEQQRQLTIFRAIGFTVLDISNVWTLQSIAQILVSSIVGVPAGALSIYILLKLCSSSSQTYPFIFSWPTVFIAIGFILLVVIACHLLAMNAIRRWNIADNTRSRE